MSEKLLLASGIQEWREAIEIGLSGCGCKAEGVDGSDLIQATLSSDPISIIIDADCPTAQPDPTSASSILQTLVERLRQQCPSKHVIFVAPAPSEKLSSLIAEYAPADLLLDSGADCFGLASEILTTINRLRPPATPSATPDFATIEIEVHTTLSRVQGPSWGPFQDLGPIKWQRQRPK